VLRVREHALVLETMHYHDEVGDVSELDLPAKASVNERERELAVQIIESMATSFEPERYTDEYREQLEELIRQRAEGVEETALAQPAPEPGGKVIDLMEALKKSLARRTEQAAGSETSTKNSADAGSRNETPSKTRGKRQGKTQPRRKAAGSAKASGTSRASSTTRRKSSGARSGSGTRRTAPKKHA
jgi:DNA end-binding protein Ku